MKQTTAKGPRQLLYHQLQIMEELLSDVNWRPGIAGIAADGFPCGTIHMRSQRRDLIICQSNQFTLSAPIEDPTARAHSVEN